MRTSFIGRSLIKTFEGYRGVAYRCPSGVWTIGWGHTTGVGQAGEWLKTDLAVAERTVEAAGLALSQTQFDALVSLVFNIGPGTFNGSTLLRLLRQDTMPRAETEEAWKSWRMAGGTVQKGLVRRRAAEYTLYSRGFF